MKAKHGDIYSDFLKSVETLTRERETIDELIEKWEQKLAGLDIKIEAWVKAREQNGTPGRPARVDFGYHGGLVVRYSSPDGSRVEPLSQASYEIKLEALCYLSELLIDIQLMVEDQIARIRRVKSGIDFEALRKRLRLPLIKNPQLSASA